MQFYNQLVCMHVNDMVKYNFVQLYIPFHDHCDDDDSQLAIVTGNGETGLTVSYKDSLTSPDIYQM